MRLWKRMADSPHCSRGVSVLLYCMRYTGISSKSPSARSAAPARAAQVCRCHAPLSALARARCSMPSRTSPWPAPVRRSNFEDAIYLGISRATTTPRSTHLNGLTRAFASTSASSTAATASAVAVISAAAVASKLLTVATYCRHRIIASIPTTRRRRHAPPTHHHRRHHDSPPPLPAATNRCR
jgi:hypothetical protein